MSNFNKIKGYRSMLGMNQEEFAKSVQINPRTYFNRENGLTAFTVDELVNIKTFLIAKGFRVTLEDLV